MVISALIVHVEVLIVLVDLFINEHRRQRPEVQDLFQNVIPSEVELNRLIVIVELPERLVDSLARIVLLLDIGHVMSAQEAYRTFQYVLLSRSIRLK